MRVDLPAVDDDPAAGGGQQAAQDAQQRRLARARRPLDRHDLAPRHGERDPAEHRHLVRPFAVDLRHVVGLEHGHEHRPSVPDSAQPRKTIAGSSDATLRNDSDAAPRQSACVPTKTRAASVGETIILMSNRARTGPRPSVRARARP